MESPSQPFDILPALHLRGGRLVDLAPDDPGAGPVDTGLDPVATARHWIEQGARWIHVVDVDGKFDRDGAPNRRIVERLCELPVRVQFGGGVRTGEDIAWAMRTGVERVMIWTAAAESPELVGRAIAEHGRERFALAVATDERGDTVTHGSQPIPGMAAAGVAAQMYALGVGTAVHMRVTPDGTMIGTDPGTSAELAGFTGMNVIVGGEVRDMDDVVDCYNRPGITGVLIGRALQSGRIDLGAALDETRASLAFESGMPRWREEELTMRVQLRRTLARGNLVHHLPEREGLRVLDAGGGNGAASLHLALEGAHVDAVDRSLSMLAECEAHAEREGVRHRVSTERMDLREVEHRFAPDTFDVVVCHNVVQYSPDWERLLRSVVAPLKPGGTLSLVVRNWYAEPYELDVEAHAPEALPGLIERARTPSRVFDADVLLFSAPYLSDWLDAHGLDVVGDYGLLCRHRVPEAEGPAAREALLARLVALESAMGARAPFRYTARYVQLVATKRGRGGE